MRVRNSLLVVASMGCLLFSGGVAFGQPRVNNPYIQRPKVSPYINLLRGGNQPLLYQGLIGPQQDYYRFREQQGLYNQQFQSGLRQLSQQGTGVSGHQTSFFNYSHYYRFGGR